MFGGSAWNAVMKVAVLIVLARLLSPLEFGLIGAALVVVSFGEIASRLGIGPAVVQRPELHDDHLRAGFAISMALALSIAVAVYFCASFIAEFFRMHELAPIVQVMALIFPIVGLGIVAEGLIQREMRFKALAGIEVSSYALGYAATGIVLASFGFGVWSLALAQLTQAALKTTFLWLIRPHPVGFRIPLRASSDLLNYGTGFSIAKLGNAFAGQADNLVVGRWLGAEALGLYGRAYSVLMMPTKLIGGALDRVMFPAMASVQNDRERLAQAYCRAVAAVALVAIPASGMLIVVAPELVWLVLGEQWMSVVFPIQVLAVILFFRIGYKLSDSLARALGAVYRRAWRQWIYAAAVFGGAWFGQFWGLGGVAVGVAAAIAINYLLMLHLSLRLVDLSWYGIFQLHFHYLAVGLFITGASWLAVYASRSVDLHSVAVIASAACGAASSILILQMIRVPWLNKEGRWIVDRLIGLLPKWRA